MNEEQSIPDDIEDTINESISQYGCLLTVSKSHNGWINIGFIHRVLMQIFFGIYSPRHVAVMMLKRLRSHHVPQENPISSVIDKHITFWTNVERSPESFESFAENLCLGYKIDEVDTDSK